MDIEFTKTGKRATVTDQVGNALIVRGLARKAIETREMESEISPRTGKPKRQYRRRDMQAEG